MRSTLYFAIGWGAATLCFVLRCGW